MNDTQLVDAMLSTAGERLDDATGLKLGDWVWVLEEGTSGRRKDPRTWFGCITHVGTNYVQVTEPARDRCQEVIRVHFNDVPAVLRYEPDHASVIASKIAHYQGRVSAGLKRAREISYRLGLASRSLGGASSAGNETMSLSLVAQSGDVAKYEKDLVRAKEVELPEIYKQIESDNHGLCQWMSAEALGLMAEFKTSKTAIESINDRIFNISLYAGLIERVVKCCDGEPASMDEKLHIMQRRLYMDEESLLDYTHGGMEFSSIGEFDRWICRPKNRDRIMPFQRCIVAMRIRRHVKHRQNLNTIISFLDKADKDLSDRFTYLYIRNGEQVYRLSTEIDFDEKLFPDRADFDPSEPMMYKRSSFRSDRRFMPVREYEERVKRQEELSRLIDVWKAENPDGHWGENPYYHDCDYQDFRASDWERLDSSSVYFDDGMQNLSDVIKKYNRVSLVVQGLLDRSSCLHPHPPVKMWDPEDFARYIRLVYDSENILNYGEPPDFEAYRQRCNESLGKGAVVVGQRYAWKRREAERENRRNSNNWRLQGRMPHYEEFIPWGNPGPAYVCEIKEWQPRARKATFRWKRKAVSSARFDELIDDVITVHEDCLFNVSAYQPGDYLQFFQDPRTREKYLQWAPMLLAAEGYTAGIIVKDVDEDREVEW